MLQAPSLRPKNHPILAGFGAVSGFWGVPGGCRTWGLGSKTAVLAQNPKKPKKPGFGVVLGGTPKKAKKRVFGVKIRSKSGLVLSLLTVFAKNLSLIRGLGVPKTTLFGTPKPTPNRGLGSSGGPPKRAVWGVHYGAPAEGKNTHTGTLGSRHWVVL